MKNRLLLIVPAAALLMVGLGTLTQNANAWGDWGGGPGCCGGGGYWNQGVGGFDNPYQNGLEHGIADAQYDHQNNLVYNAEPACDSCHTPLYLDGFRHGYDQQWNTYQNTEQNSQQTVNNYINVKISPGAYINLNDRQNNDQNSDQGQSNVGPGPTPYQQDP